MQSALSVLVDLEAVDTERLLAIGTEREVHRGDAVITEGVQPSELYIVLEGLVEARLNALGGHVLGRLGQGELLGEVSWLEERPASATVLVVEDALLLAIPRAALAKLLESDAGLATRLHRALGRLVARRLRARSDELGVRTAASRGAAALRELTPWRRIEPAIDSLKDLLISAEGQTRKAGGALPRDLVTTAQKGMGALSKLLKAELGPGAGLDEALRDEVGALVRRELHPYLLLSRVMERIYTKPRGYAGDFLTIQWMYENTAGGSSAGGILLDSVCLELPSAKAVRNRRALLANEIATACTRGGKVTSLACGPAEELFDVFRGNGADLKATLLDIDLQALALVSDRRDQLGLKPQMRLEHANLVYLATGRARLDFPPQDLIYSIGLIDYFQDRFVVALLDWIHERLATGGKVILGNFHPQNPDRELMDHVLDWRLIHRDENHMNALFQASRFGRPCTEIRFEAECVNLFAMGVKE